MVCHEDLETEEELTSSTTPCLKNNSNNGNSIIIIPPSSSNSTNYNKNLLVPFQQEQAPSFYLKHKRLSFDPTAAAELESHDSDSHLRPKSPNYNNFRRRKSSLASIQSAVVKSTTILCHRISDVLASTCIVLPLVVGFWRGIWVIMDYYSAEWNADPWASMGIGLVIPFSFHLFQQQLRELVHPDKMNFTLFYIISRLLLLLHSFGSVNQWRGLWAWFDQKTGLTFESAMTTMVVGVIVSMGLKVFCNNLAVPLYIGVDDVNNIHDCPLRFKSSPEKKLRYFWDVVWSVIIVQSLVIAAWRGLWTLADLYLYPDQPILSALITIGIGNGLVIILCLFQPIYYEYISKMKGFTRLILFDTVTLFGYIGTVLSWRGLWNLFGEVIVFETPLLGEWLTTGIGTIGCLLLGCISTVVIRGASIDSEDVEEGGAVSEWSISYVSLLRKKNNSIPFPEPWLFRYFCTKQRMTPQERLRRMSEYGAGKIRRASAFIGIAITEPDPSSSSSSSSDEESNDSGLEDVEEIQLGSHSQPHIIIINEPQSNDNESSNTAELQNKCPPEKNFRTSIYIEVPHYLTDDEQHNQSELEIYYGCEDIEEDDEDQDIKNLPGPETMII